MIQRAQQVLDLYGLFLLGMVGYVLPKFDFHLAPMVVGVVVGPVIEKYLREGLFMSQGRISVLYSSATAIAIWVLVVDRDDPRHPAGGA